MSRLHFVNLTLFAALAASCLSLIQVTYEARRLFVAVERAQNEEQALETEHARLQVERRAEGTLLRVEALAREKLQMRPPTPGVTHYVSSQGRAVAEPVQEAAAAERPLPGALDASAQEAPR